MSDLAHVSRTIGTPGHGRYVVAAPPAGTAFSGLLLGFHGYAQNAETMLADLDSIPGSASWLRVSLQGLHRFYNKAGQVVASWMTSEDRELAIADNLEYVRRVLEAITADATALAQRPVVFLGFSQGTSMAFRAAAKFGCTAVIGLGGDVPPDVRARTEPLPPVLLGRGTKDEWYTDEKLSKDLAWLESSHTRTTVCRFEGGHVWTDAFRTDASTFLRQFATGKA